MTSTPIEAAAQHEASAAAPDLLADWLLNGRDAVRRHLAPKDRRPGVSSYRIFMTIVFIGVVVVDEWSDRSVSAAAGADVVGPASVVVWALTLLGSFGIGPVATIWGAFRR